MISSTLEIADWSSYRLGPFGFLTSEELRKAGYKANNGIRDQRVAMQWVQKHISDFGGDPDNVTLAGMSAGGGKAFSGSVVRWYQMANIFQLPSLSIFSQTSHSLSVPSQ